MDQDRAGFETIAQITFNTIATHIGKPVMEQLFVQAEAAQAEGRNGVTFSDDTETSHVTIGDDGMVNFRFGRWGPYKLAIENARMLLQSTE